MFKSFGFHIVLYQPVIPQNTGSIARLCGATDSKLHLIHPLGFKTDEASVRRAGLDYWEHVEVLEYENWEDFLNKNRPEFLYFFSKKATEPYCKIDIPQEAFLVFGSETKGLDGQLWEKYPEKFYQIPMRTDLVRSLNLAQSAALVLYEGIRQASLREDPCSLK